MTNFTIYEYKGDLEAVKNGFTWLAFLSLFYWFFDRNLNKWGWIIVIASILIGWTGIGQLGIMIYCGIKASDVYDQYLLSIGYERRDTFVARDKFDAIRQYLNRDIQKGDLVSK